MNFGDLTLDDVDRPFELSIGNRGNGLCQAFRLFVFVFLITFRSTIVVKVAHGPNFPQTQILSAKKEGEPIDGAHRSNDRYYV